MSRRTLQFNVFACLALVVLSLGLANGGQSGQRCDGESHCAPTQPCDSPGKNKDGFPVSCTMTLRILHKKCIVSPNPEDSCTVIKVPCARVDVYAGNPCINGQCSYDSISSYELTEDGC